MLDVNDAVVQLMVRKRPAFLATRSVQDTERREQEDGSFLVTHFHSRQTLEQFSACFIEIVCQVGVDDNPEGSEVGQCGRSTVYTTMPPLAMVMTRSAD